VKPVFILISANDKVRALQFKRTTPSQASSATCAPLEPTFAIRSRQFNLLCA
jgi:hypothetical protein